MIFVFTLLPLYCVSFLKLWGAGVALVTALLSIIIVPIFLKIKSKKRQAFLIPLGVALRCIALFSAVREKASLLVSLLLVFATLALSAASAYRHKCALYSTTPIFFIILGFALYTAFTSQTQEGLLFDFKSPINTLFCVTCLLSSCKSASEVARERAKTAVKGLVIGIATALTILLFGGNNTDFGFAAVLITVALTAIDIKAFFDVILIKTDE